MSVLIFGIVDNRPRRRSALYVLPFREKLRIELIQKHNNASSSYREFLSSGAEKWSMRLPV
jgi:hypothetical protein